MFCLLFMGGRFVVTKIPFYGMHLSGEWETKEKHGVQRGRGERVWGTGSWLYVLEQTFKGALGSRYEVNTLCTTGGGGG